MMIYIHLTDRRMFYYKCFFIMFLYLLQQSSSGNQECGYLFVENTTMKGEVLTLEENSLLNITFSFKNISCTMGKEFNFEILFKIRMLDNKWSPQCHIMLKENLCRGSPAPDIVCTCLTKFTYMFQKRVNKKEAKYWKLSSTSTNIRVVYFNINVTEQTSLNLHESTSSIEMKGLFRESDGPTEGNTFSMIPFHDMTTAVQSTVQSTFQSTIQSTLRDEKIEIPLMAIIIYILGAVIIIVIVLAIVICFIVRKINMKDTLHSDVMKSESRLEMSKSGPSIREDVFAESANSSAYMRPTRTETIINECTEYTEIHSYVDICP